MISIVIEKFTHCSLNFKVVLRLTMCDMIREYFTICVDKVLGWGQVSLLPQTS